MKTVTIVYWQEEDGLWQGETLEELKNNFEDLNQENVKFELT